MLPYLANGLADWFEQMRPGKKLQAVHETLSQIATQMEKLPSESSLTTLTGQVERLEQVLSQGTPAKRWRKKKQKQKNKATPKSMGQHVNGAAQN